MNIIIRTSVILIGLLTITCCKENAKQDSNNTKPEEVLTVNIPSDFVTFYNKFHSDSIFQMDHIVFPLAQKDDGTKWQKENWKIHKAFNDQNGAYTRSFDNFNGLIFETIVEKTGAFKIVKRYSKTNDEYNLIYYTTEVSFKDWETEGNSNKR